MNKLTPPKLDNPYLAIQELAQKLRNPDKGCPWDIKQTFSSVENNIIEEAYELVDAIQNLNLQNSQSVEHFREELGDLAFQVVFQSQMAKEKDLFTLDDVFLQITQKLIYRHPHVFQEDFQADTSEEVLKNWEKLKTKEKQKKNRLNKIEKASILGEIPNHLPALLKASRLGQKASRFHFDWPDIDGVWDKLEEEIEELQNAVAENNQNNDKENIEEEMGDLLFTISQLARKYDIDPEAALQKANKKFMERFYQCEEILSEQLQQDNYPTLEEWNRVWEKVKEKR